MFLINMIKSGLVNQRKGGGFEEGYPHERDARNVYDIRPYVDSIDTGFQKPSDFSIIIPKAVSYAHIFSKKLTPSEKVFLAKQVKRGLKSASRPARKAYTGKDDYEEEAKPLPDKPEPEFATPEEPAPKEPSLAQQLSGVDEQGNDDLYNEELEAEDVVYPPAPRETFDEQEEAEMMWEDREMEDVVMDRKNIKKDDIAVTKENRFGGNVKLPPRKSLPKSKVPKKTKEINGVGPRNRSL